MDATAWSAIAASFPALAWHLDKRTSNAAAYFSIKLRKATNGRFQLSTDGFRSYAAAVPAVFGNNIDFAQLVKTYGNTPEHMPKRKTTPAMAAELTDHVWSVAELLQVINQVQ